MTPRQSRMNLTSIKSQITHGRGFHVHLKYSRGGTVTCRMWHPDGFVMGRAGGGGYDKKGAAFGEALMKLFLEELQALPLPTRHEMGRVISGLYGMAETKDGKRYLDGACGFDCMIKIVNALGYSVETFSTGKDSDLVIAREMPKAGSFVAYLEETLIPDLRESGRDLTADDFETAIKIIKGGA